MKAEALDLESLRQYWPEAAPFEPLPPDYEGWRAEEKETFLWEKRIVPSRYTHLPPLQSTQIAQLFLTVLREKMERRTDEAPVGWKKAIHAHGTVAKIRFLAAPDTPFTGLFRGAECGLLRASLTARPQPTGFPLRQGFAPGLAIKFFVDGRASENFSALVSLDGQGSDRNFFANEFSNIVPVVRQLAPIVGNLIFRRVTRFPRHLALEGFSHINRAGKPVGEPLAPVRLFLVPGEMQFSAAAGRDFRDDLATVAAGSTIFSIYGVDPRTLTTAELERIDTHDCRAKAIPIGRIETKSEFTASFYGDNRLFFQHQRFSHLRSPQTPA